MKTSNEKDLEKTFECASCGHVWKAEESQPCPKCKNVVAIAWDEVGVIGWGRSFFLAFLSLIVGFLFASIWFILYIFVKYELFIHFYAPYYPRFFSESFDLNWLILDAVLSVLSPFISFRYVPYNQGNQFSLPFTVDSPMGGLIGMLFGQFFNIVDIIDIFVRFVISFLVYASFFVPIIKFSLTETKRSVSWLKAFILGIKTAIVGIILSALLLLVGGLFLFAVVLGLSSGSTGSPQTPPNLNMVIALVFIALIAIIMIAVLVYTATGATIIRYTTKEASRFKIGCSWGRSFLVSVKANIVAILWQLLFGFVFGIFAVVAIAGSIETQSPFALGGSIIAIFIFLIIVVILSELSPIASIIKYLVEEIEKNYQLEKEEKERAVKSKTKLQEGKKLGIEEKVAFLTERYAKKGYINPKLRLESEISKKMESGKTREQAIKELLKESKA